MNAQSAIYQQYKPTEDKENKSFNELIAINPDVLGWIEIEGTGIDYPLVQGESNNEYLNRDAEGHYSSSGSIFLDCRCKPDFSDFNTIIYGHHMARSAMFGDLDKYVDREFFKKHRYGKIFYGGSEHEIEFFAFIENADGYNGEIYKFEISDEEAKQGYIDYLLSSSKYTRKNDLTNEDHLVLLSTCSHAVTNGRFILAGRINEEGHKAVVKKDNIRKVELIDINRWLLTLILVLTVLLLAVLFKLHNKRRFTG